jgi:hypothetical protein
MSARPSENELKVRQWHGDANSLRDEPPDLPFVHPEARDQKCAYCAERLSVYLRGPSVDYTLPRSTMK